MSTIGHPLSDLVNLLSPYSLSGLPGKDEFRKFQDGVTPGLPTQSLIIQWYAEVAGWDPTPDIAFGKAFGFFKAAFIYQGIAARHALRQASSTQALYVGSLMHPVGELTWSTSKRRK